MKSGHASHRSLHALMFIRITDVLFNHDFTGVLACDYDIDTCGTAMQSMTLPAAE